MFVKSQHNITSTTKAIFSSVGNKKWWKSKIDWVGYGKEATTKDSGEMTAKDHLKIIHHPFYASASQNQARQTIKVATVICFSFLLRVLIIIIMIYLFKVIYMHSLLLETEQLIKTEYLIKLFD